MVNSPDLTPERKVSDPKTPVICRGLFGANGSSSIGLKTAAGFELQEFRKYTPEVPSTDNLGGSPAKRPLLTVIRKYFIARSGFSVPKTDTGSFFAISYA